MTEKAYGAIELGGTKIVGLIAKDRSNILTKHIFPTRSPEQSILELIGFFKNRSKALGVVIHHLGIGCFGPLDLDPHSQTFGSITSTPKTDWKFTDIKGNFENGLQIPVFIDTDVNAAALGEFSNLPDKAIQNFAYLTIGTGIGGGFIVNGKLIHGLVHPEFGLINIPHNKQKDPFIGCCPYHGDCFEGLASGPALEKRWGIFPKNLPENHKGWDLEAGYIGSAIMNLIFTISPQKIILGGGVMHQTHLFSKIHEKTKRLMNNYIKSKYLDSLISDLITPPKLKNDSGIIGALELAIRGSEG